MRRAAALLVLLALAGCTSGGGSSKDITATVNTWAPEGSNHVAAQVTFTNNGASAATAVCSFQALDDGGSDVGDDADGPADNIAPGQSVVIRLLIKTSVEGGLVSDVRMDSAAGCD